MQADDLMAQYLEAAAAAADFVRNSTNMMTAHLKNSLIQVGAASCPTLPHPAKPCLPPEGGPAGWAPYPACTPSWEV